MEKEFVPYELAIKLKLIGFNEPCFAYFQEQYDELSPVMVTDDAEHKRSGFRTCINSEIPENFTSAPTFYQAFRWFRKEHNLFTWIDKYESRYRVNIHNQVSNLTMGDGGFVIPEFAEYNCLTRLIEILEKRKKLKSESDEIQ